MLNLELKSVKELKELQFQVSEALARRRLQRAILAIEASRDFVNTSSSRSINWVQEKTKVSTVEQSRDILIMMSRNYTTVHNLPMFNHYLEVLELVLDLDDE